MAIFPSAIATDSDLFVAVNMLSTQLTDNPLSNSATTVNVVDASAFPSVGYISIDAEIIKYTGKTGTSFTGCTRAADGSTAASHVQNSQVFHNVIAAHHNVLKDEIKAIETALGINPSFLPLAGGTLTGNVAMGGTYKLTGLAAGTTNGDSLRYEQLVGAYLPLSGGTLTGNLTVPNGAEATPSISFASDATTGIRYRSANILAVSTGGTTPVEFTKINKTDGSNENPAVFYYGPSALTYISAGTNTTITTAKTICFTNNAAGLVIVHGTDGSNSFVDLILSTDAAVTPTVITSKTIAGSPAARTYSVSGGATKVAFASGTYSAKAFCIGIG